jgi:hypothetical protein
LKSFCEAAQDLDVEFSLEGSIKKVGQLMVIGTEFLWLGTSYIGLHEGLNPLFFVIIQDDALANVKTIIIGSGFTPVRLVLSLLRLFL